MRPAQLCLVALIVLASAGSGLAQAPPPIPTTIVYEKDEVPDKFIVSANQTVSILWVPDDYEILDINVYILISDDITDGTDLSYSLRSPNGTVVRLKSEGVPGGINTVYDQQRQPIDDMAVFDGEQTFGAWTLSLNTTDEGSSGPLKGWQVWFTVDNAVAGTVGHNQPLAGLGDAGNAGRFEVFDNDIGGFQPLLFGTLPFATYNALNGETRIAAGNIDGDRRDELVVGLGPSSVSSSLVAVLDDSPTGFALRTWLRPPWTFEYDVANGETWVATGDVDGDGLDEIVVGQGTFALDGGRFAVFDDGRHQYRLLRDGRIPWTVYNAANGEVRPAAGDVDGDGRAELVMGLGAFPANGGYVAVFEDKARSFRFMRWARLAWPVYNAAVGATRPACGDLDGDRRDEVVLGLDSFPANGGFAQVLDDKAVSFRSLGFIRLPFVAYDTANGATRPACGDVDRDRRAEILLGTGPNAGNTFNMALFDDARIRFGFRRFFTVQDAAYTAANGETWPTLGMMR